jgi:hypothetical protein
VCSWGDGLSVCVKNVTSGPGLSSILLIDGTLLRAAVLRWEGLATRASKGSSPAAGKEGTAARDIVAVGGGAKKGLTSDGGVYIVFT